MNNRDIVDIVFIVGEDQASKYSHNRFCKQIEDECKRKNLKYVFVGDGQIGATLDGISNLPLARHAVVLAHSKVANEKHHLVLNRGDDIFESIKTFFSILPKPGAYPSLDIIKLIQEKTQAKNIIFGSCYGAMIADEIKKLNQQPLLNGTSMLIASSATEASYLDDTILTINNFVKKITPGQEAIMLEVTADANRTNPGTKVFVHKPESTNSIVTHTFRRTERAEKEICMDIEKFCEYQLAGFNEFIDGLIKDDKNKEIIKQSQLVSYPLKMEMTQIQKQALHKLSFERHVSYNDIQVVERLLVNVKFTSMFYLYVLCNAIDDAVSKKNNNLIPMVKLLLDHKEHTTNWDKNDLNEAMERHINSHGFNPLTLAIEHENTEIINLLLKHGANVFLPDQKERTPIDMMLDNPKYKSIGEDYLRMSKTNDNKTTLQHISMFSHENMANINNKNINTTPSDDIVIKHKNSI